MYLRVLSARLIVAAIEKRNMILKGVVVPSLNSSRLCEGVVISPNSELKTGDKVLYIKTEELCYDLNSLKVDIVNISDIVAVFQVSYNKWN
ncbi:10 kDa chaperonin [Candidatus Hodgkinia cicadicola]|uniref:10 kDa chaperonin n=1 Tax=Candidatus Hodgkinia cicadicola TaxID=573658 RepID=A0ABX4MHZ2_9HYPH|nr:10 kDa chaperonin [Candidatus Hodgkinia cicadicola]